jgi:hypothetical protein
MIPEGSQKEVCTPFIETKGNQIEIYCKTPGSSIAFRILGKNDAVNRWQLYTHPITLNKGEMIEAIGCRIGYSQSEIVTKFYN